jgi:hypothetical protein
VPEDRQERRIPMEEEKILLERQDYSEAILGIIRSGLGPQEIKEQLLQYH